MVDGPDLGYANPRVIMIRRIKGVILIILLVLMILLMYIQYMDSMKPFEDSHYKPILPMEPILFALMLMAFIMTIVSIIFKSVEIKASETGSQKYLLAHSSMKAAVTTLIIAAVFAVILYIIPTMPAAQDILNSEDPHNVDYGNTTYSFSSSDEFLISDTTAVHYKVSNGVNLNGTIYPKNDYENGNFAAMVKDSHSQIKWPSGTTDYVYDQELPYGKYILEVENSDIETANVKFIVERKVKDSLLWTLLLFCIMFAILEGVWTAVAFGIKHKYKSESIYR